jgi:hypothetical protein
VNFYDHVAQGCFFALDAFALLHEEKRKDFFIDDSQLY